MGWVEFDEEEEWRAFARRFFSFSFLVWDGRITHDWRFWEVFFLFFLLVLSLSACKGWV
jgi:hypothetical protein